MWILFDTNVLADLLFGRDPYKTLSGGEILTELYNLRMSCDGEGVSDYLELLKKTIEEVLLWG